MPDGLALAPPETPAPPRCVIRMHEFLARPIFDARKVKAFRELRSNEELVLAAFTFDLFERVNCVLGGVFFRSPSLLRGFSSVWPSFNPFFFPSCPIYLSNGEGGRLREASFIDSQPSRSRHRVSHQVTAGGFGPTRPQTCVPRRRLGVREGVSFGGSYARSIFFSSAGVIIIMAVAVVVVVPGGGRIPTVVGIMTRSHAYPKKKNVLLGNKRKCIIVLTSASPGRKHLGWGSAQVYRVVKERSCRGGGGGEAVSGPRAACARQGSGLGGRDV